jgi:hypothetical protein
LAEAGDISSGSTGKLLTDSDPISLATETSDRVRMLLQKSEAVLSRLHAMILPKADQQKTLEQLADTFSVNTEGTIAVFKHTSRTYRVLLDFQLLMGYGFKAKMELLTKELPKGPDGLAIDLSSFKASARKCTIQLLELVSANKSTAGGAIPCSLTQTQAP